MKTTIVLILSLILLLTQTVAKSNNIDQELKNKLAKYDKLFEQISKKRVGVSNSKIDTVKNPFIMANNKAITKDNSDTIILKKSTFVLTAILNKKAKLNGKWYKINSVIGDFRLTDIKNNSVIITNKHSKKELFLRRSSVNKIKFSSK